MRRKADPIVEKIEGEVERALASFGYELVQLKLGGRPGSRTLTVLMDCPGGVTLADCQYMSKRLSVLLDALDPIPEPYSLVVSSPGVNRPLTRDTDFERFAGQRVVVRWAPTGGRAQTRRGLLLGVEGEAVRLEVEGSETRIPLAEIDSASIVYDWDNEPQRPKRA